MFKLLYCTFIQDNVYQILSESTGFCKNIWQNIWCVFPVHSVDLSLLGRNFAQVAQEWFVLYCAALVA